LIHVSMVVEPTPDTVSSRLFLSAFFFFFLFDSLILDYFFTPFILSAVEAFQSGSFPALCFSDTTLAVPFFRSFLAATVFWAFFPHPGFSGQFVDVSLSALCSGALAVMFPSPFFLSRGCQFSARRGWFVLFFFFQDAFIFCLHRVRSSVLLAFFSPFSQ